MTANCASMRGEQSTLAPTSTTTTGVPLRRSGNTPASAGRSTPGTTPCTILAVAMTAPVLPAETKPWATPSRTSREATRMRAVTLGADGSRRAVVHGDAFAGVDDLDGQIASDPRVLREFAPDHVLAGPPE